MSGSRSRDWDDEAPDKRRKPKRRNDYDDEAYVPRKKKNSNKRDYRKQNQKEKLWDDLTRIKP